MKSFNELKDEFDKRVSWLQKHCKHEKSSWMISEWAPGHYNGEVLVCLFCNKVIDKRFLLDSLVSITTTTYSPDVTDIIYVNT